MSVSSDVQDLIDKYANYNQDMKRLAREFVEFLTDDKYWTKENLSDKSKSDLEDLVKCIKEKSNND